MSRLLRAALMTAVLAPAAAGAAGADVHLVVISGLGGEEEYSDLFHDWSLSLIDSAIEAGVAADDIRYLAEDPSRAPDRIDGAARREEILRIFADQAAGLDADDELWIAVFGHGSARSGDAKISLPGPDMGGGEFAEALAGVRAGRIIVVNAASASGEFVAALSGPNRVIVTATRSAAEQHAPTFGGFFVAAFAGGAADTDKDERVSLLEAFRYARQEVERRFESEQLLLTEHALLDDNGDREGSMQPELKAGVDGLLASQVFLGRPRVLVDEAVADTPELRTLARRKEELEGRIAELRAQRESMDEATYLEELEAVLLELATTSETLRQAGVGGAAAGDVGAAAGDVGAAAGDVGAAAGELP